MAALVAETDVEGMVGFAIADGNGKRPDSTQTALMIINAEGLIKGELKLSTLVDTYGALKVVELSLIARMIREMRSFSNPQDYMPQNVILTPEEIRLIRIATGSYGFLTFEVGH